jgi:hypothetical protein
MGRVGVAVALEFDCPNCRLIRSFLSGLRYSLRTCNFASLRFVRFLVESRVRNFVRIIPKTLNKRSHDTEFAEMERRRQANVTNSGAGLVGWQKLRSTAIGSNCRLS